MEERKVLCSWDNCPDLFVRQHRAKLDALIGEDRAVYKAIMFAKAYRNVTPFFKTVLPIKYGSLRPEYIAEPSNYKLLLL